MNKYVYEYIVQGHYGYGWDDLTAHDSRKEALAERKVYDANEPNPHRVIHRRTLRSETTP